MSNYTKATKILVKMASSNEMMAMGLILQSALRVTQTLSKDVKAQDKYIESVIVNLGASDSSDHQDQGFNIPKVPQIPLFEDIYGNKMGDTEFHIMVYRKLMGLNENETDWVTEAMRAPPGE